LQQQVLEKLDKLLSLGADFAVDHRKKIGTKKLEQLTKKFLNLMVMFLVLM